MKKIVLLILLAGMTTAAAKAQGYNWGVGLRGGATATGITVKGFVNGADAIEGIASFVNGVNIYLLYERYMPVIGKGFSFYYGGGGNIGTWRKHKKDKFTLGIDGVIGLDFKVPLVPLSFGIDYKPCINFIGHTGFKWYDFGVHARVAF